MHTVDLERMGQMAKKKVDYQKTSPLGYVVLAILAGVYLGFGITLIFSVGAPFAAEGSAAVKLVMGASFGIALTLIIFAGSELFTGNNMVCTIGALAKGISWSQLSQIFFWSFLGNLVGSLGIAWLVAQSGVLANAPHIDFLMKVAGAKMSLPAWELFLRGILCNWLVCLAVWMAMRTTNETAKIMLLTRLRRHISEDLTPVCGWMSCCLAFTPSVQEAGRHLTEMDRRQKNRLVC